MKTLARCALNAVSLMLVPELVDGIHIRGYLAALAAALVLGLLNALLRPLLILLTLPITALTLGLFILAINALMFQLAGGLVGGFHVAGFWPALWGAIVYSLLCWLVSLALGDRKPR